VFGGELRLACDLLFGAPPPKDQTTTDHAANLVDHLHDIYNYSQHLKLASNQMKTPYYRLVNFVGYQEGYRVALPPDQHDGEIEKNSQSLREGPYKVVFFSSSLLRHMWALAPASEHRAEFPQYLNLGQSVGLLGRVISSSQGLYL
jgi:hypothetical protein